MRLALGETGATLIALGIAISALGFLSQGMLTTPRVYFAMAEDRLFFRGVAKVNAKTHAPVVAILLQGAAAIVIALTGSYGQILSYVVSVDFIWFGLTGAALFVFRRRDARGAAWFEAPGHPVTTGLFVARLRGHRRGDRLQRAGEQRGRLRDPRRRRPGLPLLAAQEKRRMRAMQSDYMHWAKTRAPVRYNLASSEVPHFRMDRWPIDPAELELDGASHYRYPPLREAIAAKEGVAPERVVMADGTSMANMLAMAALIAPGDEVLIEHPAYEPMVAAASHLGAKIRRFTRRGPDFRDRSRDDRRRLTRPADHPHQSSQSHRQSRR